MAACRPPLGSKLAALLGSTSYRPAKMSQRELIQVVQRCCSQLRIFEARKYNEFAQCICIPITVVTCLSF